MPRSHAQASSSQESSSPLVRMMHRIEEQYKLMTRIPGFNFKKLFAWLDHQRFASQIIIEPLGFERLQQYVAEIGRSQEQLSSMVQAINQSLPQLTEIIQATDSIANLVQSATIINAEMLQQIRSITQGFDDVARIVMANLSVFDVIPQVFEQLDLFKTLRERIEEIEIAVAVEAFRAAGWPIAPSMSRTLIQRVVQLYQEGKTRYVSQAIIGYYRRNNCANLAETVEKWRNHPLFASRMSIIDDALGAHCQRKYTLSVPALITQVEGIMNEYVVVNGVDVKLGKIKQVYEAVVGDPMEYDLLTWAITETLLYQLQTNTYVWTAFEDEMTRSAPRRRVTRHTILHGITPSYDRENYSLRAFLLLDALSVLQQLKPTETEVIG